MSKTKLCWEDILTSNYGHEREAQDWYTEEINLARQDGVRETLELSARRWDLERQAVARAVDTWVWQHDFIGGQQFGESMEQAVARQREDSLLSAERAMSALGFRRTVEQPS